GGVVGELGPDFVARGGRGPAVRRRGGGGRLRVGGARPGPPNHRGPQPQARPGAPASRLFPPAPARALSPPRLFPPPPPRRARARWRPSGMLPVLGAGGGGGAGGGARAGGDREARVMRPKPWIRPVGILLVWCAAVGPAPGQEHFLKIDGDRLCYEESGSGAA